MIDILSEAIRASLRHPLRGALAALGVAIALAAIVAVLAAEQSWQETLVRAYENLGANMISIGVPQEAKVRRHTLQVEDAEAIREGCSAVGMAEVTLGPRPLEVKAGRDHASLNAYGIGPYFLKIRGWRTEANPAAPRPSPEGCWISPYAADYFLGKDYRKRLPAEVKVAGRTLRLNGLVFPPGYVDNAGEGYLLVPAGRDRTLFAGQRVSVEAWARDTRKAARQIDELMSRRLGAKQVLPLSTGAWRLVAEAVAARGKLRLFTGAALTLVLAVALLGVASTLLTNLEERARELMLRRALGAQARRMAAEVLCESALVSVLGGILGCLLAYGTLRLAGQWLFRSAALPYLGSLGDLPADIAGQLKLHVPWQALLAGWVACLGGSLAAASVPANVAAGLAPARGLSLAPSRRQAVHRSLALAQLAAGVGAAVILFALYAGLASYSLRQWRHACRADVIDLLMFSNTVAAKPAEIEAVFRRNRERYQAFWESDENLAALRQRSAEFGSVYHSITTDQYYGPWAKCGRTALRVPVLGVDEGVYAHERVDAPIVVRGRGITAADRESAARVCVLSDRLASQLLGKQDPIGRQIRLGGWPFTVVGVARQSQPGPADLGDPHGPWTIDRWAIVPTTAFAADWSGYPHTTLVLRDPRQAQEAEGEFVRAIRDIARLPADMTVHVANNALISRRVEREATTLQLRALLIGSAGLWVALVGLANMLLTSAYARTREIGVLRALGATRGSVARGTLAESLALSAAGALAGTALAAVAASLLGRMVALPVALPMIWAAVVVAGAVSTSALAALLPAVQAASIHPAEALRYE